MFASSSAVAAHGILAPAASPRDTYNVYTEFLNILMPSRLCKTAASSSPDVPSYTSQPLSDELLQEANDLMFDVLFDADAVDLSDTESVMTLVDDAEGVKFLDGEGDDPVLKPPCTLASVERLPHDPSIGHRTSSRFLGGLRRVFGA
ncbi:hypothetical protein FISHEDRAFT_72874 [Fistulina hepatica ATCC 64428]|nr:hypothetical protein FISHEDRAFT_72874 [Fistulina hepatica ATCC 64428]